MKRALLVVFVLLAAPACKGTPDHVCKRLVALTSQKLGKTNLVTKDDKDTMEANCISDMEAMKKDQPKRYECQAACVNDAKDLDEIDPCIHKCPKDE